MGEGASVSQPLVIARHIISAGYPFTVRQLCSVFPDMSYKQIDCACWRAARAGWLKRERFDKRSIAYAPGVIDEERARFSLRQSHRAMPPAADLPARKVFAPEGVPIGIPASVWELPVHGWPAARTPMNYWPDEMEAH